MGRLYLIRHGSALPPGESVCQGSRSDPPLTTEGEAECARLEVWLRHRERLCVYSSPLLRCVQTARLVFGVEIRVHPGLTELDMGEWDGLDFAQIRKRYPELYEQRGEDPLISPPDAEYPIAAQDRILRAVDGIIKEGESAAIVSHAGVLRLLICRITDRHAREFLKISMPNGSVSVLNNHGGELSLLGTYTPAKTPNENDIKRLFGLAGTTEELIFHCRAVAEAASEICEGLEEKGYILDLPLIRSAALLHDICRGRPEHERRGGELLEREGFPAVGEIIACHRELPSELERVCEHAVVYLADKLVSGTSRVSLDERFSSSAKKCKTPEAKAAHTRRREQAERIYRLLFARDAEGRRREYCNFAQS